MKPAWGNCDIYIDFHPIVKKSAQNPIVNQKAAYPHLLWMDEILHHWETMEGIIIPGLASGESMSGLVW